MTATHVSQIAAYHISHPLQTQMHTFLPAVSQDGQSESLTSGHLDHSCLKVNVDAQHMMGVDAATSLCARLAYTNSQLLQIGKVHHAASACQLLH